MKRFFLTLLAMLCMTMAFAQTVYLVKDEGGYTNIRKGPGTNYGIEMTWQDGNYLYCTKLDNGWAKAYSRTSDGTQYFLGYISNTKLVSPPRDGVRRTLMYVVREGGYTNIRKGPGTNYSIASKVKDGSWLLVNYSDAINKAWVRVYTQQGKLRGYISANKIEVPIMIEL